MASARASRVVLTCVLSAAAAVAGCGPKANQTNPPPQSAPEELPPAQATGPATPGLQYDGSITRIREAK